MLLVAACSEASTLASADGGALADEEVVRDAAPAVLAIEALTREGIGSENGSGWAHTGQAAAEIDWKQGPFARVTLVVDLESACYPFAKWALAPPPFGQSWPAQCDAFDRNLSVWLEEHRARAEDATAEDAAAEDATAEDASADVGGSMAVQGGSAGDGPRHPPFEIMHAITPFGGPLHLEADVTDLANAMPGAHRLRVELGSYSDPAGKVTGSNAGWTVSARLDVELGTAPRRVLAAVPVFARSAVALDTVATGAIEAPPGTVAGRLEYRTSGHGQAEPGDGCFGPAEEFCDRVHQITVDGAVGKSVRAYRRNCAALCSLVHVGAVDGGSGYCLENPCGDMKSVRASRANWCPGSMTAPFVWDDLPGLQHPGSHTIAVDIGPIVEGGLWLMSATYYAYGR